MRFGASRLLALSAVAACGAEPGPGQTNTLTLATPTQAFAEALARSRFVFTGRVEQLGATTTNSVRATPNAVIVSVRADSDTVWLAPRRMRSISGRPVTVIVGDPRDLSVGKEVLFFATGLASDSGLALRETARADFSRSERNTYTTKLREAWEYIAQERVRAAVSRSALVVLARVDSVTEIALPDSVARQASFEHAPLWRRAVASVELTFQPAQRGTADAATVVRLLFPGSRDVAFRRAPRPVAGERYVFLLRRATEITPRNRIGIDPAGLFFIADSIDALPPADTTRVRLALR